MHRGAATWGHRRSRRPHARESGLGGSRPPTPASRAPASGTGDSKRVWFKPPCPLSVMVTRAALSLGRPRGTPPRLPSAGTPCSTSYILSSQPSPTRPRPGPSLPFLRGVAQRGLPRRSFPLLLPRWVLLARRAASSQPSSAGTSPTRGSPQPRSPEPSAVVGRTHRPPGAASPASGQVPCRCPEAPPLSPPAPSAPPPGSSPTAHQVSFRSLVCAAGGVPFRVCLCGAWLPLRLVFKFLTFWLLCHGWWVDLGCWLMAGRRGRVGPGGGQLALCTPVLKPSPVAGDGGESISLEV